jgi:hypothetical protein
MDRPAFEHLYLHANSIATLGMLRAMARLMAMPAPTEATPEMQAFAAGIEQDMNQPESFDWSVYDGIDEEVAALGRQREEALAANLPFFDECVPMAEEDEVEAADGMPDVPRYLARALAAREQLAPRIDDSYARVDQDLLASALGTLPATMAPLTGALSAEDLERWLVLYETGDENLLKVIEETRRHEPLP